VPAQAATGNTASRRPAATLLHQLVRGNLETWLSTAAERDECGRAVPLHVEAAIRGYLKCGLLTLIP